MKDVHIVVQVEDDRQVDELAQHMDRVTDEIRAHAWGYHVHDKEAGDLGMPGHPVPQEPAAWRVMNAATDEALTDPIPYEEAVEFYGDLTGEAAEAAYLEPLYAS